MYSETKNQSNKKYKFNFLHIKLDEKLKSSTMQEEMHLFKPKANEEQLAIITGNLAQLYKDGIQITTALELVSDILHNKTYKNSLLKVLVLIKQGKSLSEAFSKFNNLYPEFFIGIIAIGENTGKLYSVLKGLNIFYDKCAFVKREIKNASMYPLFIISSMVILSIFFINKIIPSFCEIYKAMNVELPANCKVIYELNNNFKDNPFITIVTISSWLLIFIIVFKCFSKKISVEKFAKLHIVKLFYEYIMVLFFSIITSAGINISKGLEHCKDSISYVYLQNKIRTINIDILRGRTLTEALDRSGIFSKYTLAIIKIREESGTIEEGFRELAGNLENKLSEQIKKYIKFISPMFIVIMASFIVIFLVGFVLPLFNNLKSGIR